jgi:hypothetical protein
MVERDDQMVEIRRRRIVVCDGGRIGKPDANTNNNKPTQTTATTTGQKQQQRYRCPLAEANARPFSTMDWQQRRKREAARYEMNMLPLLRKPEAERVSPLPSNDEDDLRVGHGGGKHTWVLSRDEMAPSGRSVSPIMGMHTPMVVIM